MFGPSLRKMIGKWLAKQELRHELWAMDDRQLADIGISRAQIEDVVEGRLARPARSERAAPAESGFKEAA